MSQINSSEQNIPNSEIITPTSKEKLDCDTMMSSVNKSSSSTSTVNGNGHDNDSDREWDTPDVVSPSTFFKCFSSTSNVNETPFPELIWTDQEEIWDYLLRKDDMYPRNCEFLDNHSELNVEMRAVLFNWMSETSHTLKLHRETYYIALYYVDKYLSVCREFPDNEIKLLGTTALFVASKIEEIYPPTLKTFASIINAVCDNDDGEDCGEDILDLEVEMLIALKWKLHPVTAIHWMNIFMQLVYSRNSKKFVEQRKYPRDLFVKICEVLDLCVLDFESLNFPCHILSASIIAYCTSIEIAMTISGVEWNELSSCMAWLKPFAEVISDIPYRENPTSISKLPKHEWHNIQIYVNSLSLLGKVQEKQMNASQESR